MSRGPGRVERAILSLMRADPDGAWTTEDLAEAAYPDAGAIEKRHRVAVLRAARRVVGGDPDWALGRGDTPGHPVILYDRSSALGVALADLKGDPLEGHRRRGPFADRQTDEADLRATLAPCAEKHHLVEPGGPCHRHAQLHAARRGATATRPWWRRSWRRTGPRPAARSPSWPRRSATGPVSPDISHGIGASGL